MNTSRSQHVSLKHLTNFFVSSGTMIVQLGARWLKLWTGPYQATALPFTRTVKELMELLRTRCSKFTRNGYCAHGRSKQRTTRQEYNNKDLAHLRQCPSRSTRIWWKNVKNKEREKEIDHLYEEDALQGVPAWPTEQRKAYRWGVSMAGTKEAWWV